MELNLNFKYLYKIIFAGLILILSNCSFPEWEWEDLKSDYDHVLNVMGMINLDPGNPSFIGLYRTTNLDELSQIFVGLDTVGYYEYDEKEEGSDEDGFWIIDSIYEPAALIKNAEVIISDDQENTWQFAFVENFVTVDTVYVDTTFSMYGYTFNWDTTFYDTNEIRINFYLDTTGTFNPQPNTNYFLSINANGYDTVTGTMRTPAYPTMIDSSMLDTIKSSSPYDIRWEPDNNEWGYLTTELILASSFDEQSLLDSSFYIRRDWCDIQYETSIDFIEGGATIDPHYCDNPEFNNLNPELYLIRLTAMDDNYYNYFIEGELEEYSNMLLDNSSTKGRSVGIEGGFGFFGSIASDYKIRVIIP